MVAFDSESLEAGDIDWRLISNSYIALFWHRQVLAESVDWLRHHGYRIVALDAGAWDDEPAMHGAVAAALDLPDYYGNNLDALNDCLGDVAAYAYGSSKDDTGFVLVLDRFDRFIRQCPRAAPIVLDIFAKQARAASLIGHRMLCLVRSDDPDIQIPPVGAMPVLWNPAEWLNSKRHPEERSC